MKAILLIGFFLDLTFSVGQTIPMKYFDLVKKADSLYKSKNYKASALTYSSAFKENGWKGLPADRYNAACCWALANYPDSAFFNLNRSVTSGVYINLGHITIDPDLLSLHKDKRWQLIIEKVKENKEKTEIGANKPLIQQLDSIYINDQKLREESNEIEKKFGWHSKEMNACIKIILKKDSVNLIKIKEILDKNGWLGPDVIGINGSTTLFLVIQHSNLETQQKYLPMMRDAVKNGKASGSSLALLEDRVALGQGKKQIYGSQIGMDAYGKYYVLPLADPDNVDMRRAEVGLQPLAEYVIQWQIKWNVEDYKKANR